MLAPAMRKMLMGLLLATSVTLCGSGSVTPGPNVGQARPPAQLLTFTWKKVADLLPPPYANPFIVQYWGFAVDTDGQRVAVSALGEVSVFRRQVYRDGGVSWVREAVMKPRPGAGLGAFGHDVAIDDDRLVIGAAGPENGGAAGYVDVYVRSGTTWTFEQRIEPQGYAPGYPSDGQFAFGRVVDLDDQTLVVGADRYDAARGAAFVYRRTGSTWALEAFLQGEVLYQDSYFGKAVAVSGERVVIGHSGLGHFQDFAGHVLVYRRTSGAWTLEQDLSGSAIVPDELGHGLAIVGERIVASSRSDVRAYDWDGSSWSLSWSTATSTVAGARGLGFDGSRIAVRDGNHVEVYKAAAAGGFSLEQTLSGATPDAPAGSSVSLNYPMLVLGNSAASFAAVYERRAPWLSP
jgi:hypothetical protein